MDFKVWLEAEEEEDLKDVLQTMILNFMDEENKDPDVLNTRSTKTIDHKIDDILSRGEIKKFLDDTKIDTLSKMAKDDPGVPISRWIDEIVSSADIEMPPTHSSIQGTAEPGPGTGPPIVDPRLSGPGGGGTHYGMGSGATNV
jgi:hypothetical protein